MPRNKRHRPKKPSAEAVTEAEGEDDEAREEPCPLQADDPTRQDIANAKNKKAREEPCQLTPEQEADVVAWFEANPCLYNKSLREYRDADKKTRIYEEKAQELNQMRRLQPLHTACSCRLLGPGKGSGSGKPALFSSNASPRQQFLKAPPSDAPPFAPILTYSRYYRNL